MDFGRCALVAYGYCSKFSSNYRLITQTIPQLDITETAVKLMKFNSVTFYPRFDIGDNDYYQVIAECFWHSSTGLIEVSLRHWPSEFNEDVIPEDFCDKIVSSLFLDAYPVVKPSMHHLMKDHTIPYDVFMTEHIASTENDAAKTIQKRWQEARLNPYCRLGFNTINRQYDEYFNK